jgi:hypothetical protein
MKFLETSASGGSATSRERSGFRGTPMGSVRTIVHDVWEEQRLDELPRETRIDIALAQFGERYCEDKVGRRPDVERRRTLR